MFSGNAHVDHAPRPPGSHDKGDARAGCADKCKLRGEDAQRAGRGVGVEER